VTDRQSVVDYLLAWCRETSNPLISIDTIQGDLRVVVGKA